MTYEKVGQRGHRYRVWQSRKKNVTLPLDVWRGVLTNIRSKNRNMDKIIRNRTDLMRRGVLLVVLLLGWMYGMGASRVMRHRTSLNEIILSYFTVDVGIGYSTLIKDDPRWKINGKVGGQVGIGYEMRLHGFWFGTGLDFQYISYTSKYDMAGDTLPFSALDTQNKSIHMRYSFDKVSSTERYIYANIPFIFGYYHRSDFYIGAGVRVGATMRSSCQSVLDYQLMSFYQTYVEPFRESHENGSLLESRTTESIDKFGKIRCTLVGEIGYDILAIARQASKADRNGLKLGAFVEYGLTNMVFAKKTSADIVGVEPFVNPHTGGTVLSLYDVKSMHAIPYLGSQRAFGKKAVPLYFGIKLTWMFEMNTNKCRTCW